MQHDETTDFACELLSNGRWVFGMDQLDAAAASSR